MNVAGYLPGKGIGQKGISTISVARAARGNILGSIMGSTYAESAGRDFARGN
jgi:hypothetical protein